MESIPASTLTAPVWPIPARLPVRPLPRRAEVVIIGAGITGVSLAHWLTLHDIDSVVLERDHMTAGASGRNAGFVLLGTAQNYAAAVARFGRNFARQIWEFTRDNHVDLRHWLEGRQDCYRQRGSWLIPLDTTEALELQAAEALMREDGFLATWHAKTTVPGSQGGLHVAEDGEVIPTRVVEAFAQPVLERVHEGVSVLSIESSANGVRISTSAGEIEAVAAVLATNGFTPSLLPGAPIIPFRGQMLATEPLPRLSSPEPAYAEHGFRYWRQLEDGRLVIGGFRNLAEPDEMGDELRIHPQIQTAIDAYATELGGSHVVAHRWTGIMAGTPDDLPLVGAVPGRLGIYLCAGYNGHGFGFATRCAHMLADTLAGSGEIPSFLHPERAFAGVS